jgi:acetoin utilization protein AcuB
MIVSNYMSRNLVVVTPGITVAEALRIMRRKNIRHLPVVEGDKLLGMVTDKDINSAVSPPLLGQLTMSEVMQAAVTVPADTSVRKAARVLFEKKITGLAVLEKSRLAGIITLADMLKVLVVILDILDRSIRLHVKIKDKDCLERIYNVINEEGAAVISVALLGEAEHVYSFRLEESRSGQADDIAAALTGMGYEVERD